MENNIYTNSKGEKVAMLSPGFVVNMMANALWRVSTNSNVGPYTAMAMHNTAARLEAMVDLLISGKNEHMKVSRVAMNRDAANRLMDSGIRSTAPSSIIGHTLLNVDYTPIGEVVRTAVYLARSAESLNLLSDPELDALDILTDLAALNWSEPFFKIKISQIPVPSIDVMDIPSKPENLDMIVLPTKDFVTIDMPNDITMG